MEKVVRDGKVAVIYSPGFGAGWYTWNTGCEALMFHPDLVNAIEANKSEEEIESIAKTLCPDGYFGASDDLEIAWIDQGTLFNITEYDGSESIKYQSHAQWFVA